MLVAVRRKKLRQAEIGYYLGGVILTLQHLRYFIALSQHLHFGKAARACFVSQPSLSQSIADLEKEMEVQLFIRGKGYVELTPAGSLFYTDATEIIRLIDNAVIRAKRVNCGLSGSLSIGILGGLSSGSFPAYVKRFKDEYPNLDVDMKMSNMKTLNLSLLQGSIDIALTRKLDVEPQNVELDWITIYKDRFNLVLHKDHPLASCEHVNLADFADESFVFLNRDTTPNTYNFTLNICANRGLSPRIVYQASTLEALCAMLKAGMGCAIIPECASVYGTGELVFKELEGEDTVSDVVLAWHRKNANSLIPLFLDEFAGGIPTSG